MDIDVEYWTGAGALETILVIDWQQEESVSRSHAFGYRWDGTRTEALMLEDVAAAGGLRVELGFGGSFVTDLYYDDSDGDRHFHSESGSWNLASTGNVHSEWGDMSGDWTHLGDWEANMRGVDSEYIGDGQMEGVNAMFWFDASRPYQNLEVPVAGVPEPGAVFLLMSGGLLLIRRRERI